MFLVVSAEVRETVPTDPTARELRSKRILKENCEWVAALRERLSHLKQHQSRHNAPALRQMDTELGRVRTEIADMRHQKGDLMNQLADQRVRSRSQFVR